MFDDKTLGARVIANPGLVTNMVLQELEARMGGTYSVADPNNPFCFQLEASSSMTAQFVRMTEAGFTRLYPGRAISADDLYAHMSDFDYVNLMANPASLQFATLMPLQWVLENAVAVSSTSAYKKLVIPAGSYITLGTRKFGLYYPIEIIVNANTGVVSGQYDTTVENPLMTLESNSLNGLETFTQNQQDFLKISFTAYQFAVSSDIASLNKTGFNKTYTYDDKFYNARVFSRASVTDDWTEMAYSLSPANYDTAEPTALLTLLEDNSSVRVQIPQVYFTTQMVAGQVRVDLYETEGALDVAIPITDTVGCALVIANEDDYSAPFQSIPYTETIPDNTTQIVGGSDPVDFATFRTRLVKGTLYDKVAVTRGELYTAAADAGFSLSQYKDSFLSRIFLASALMTDGNGRITPVGSVGIALNDANLNGDPNSIIKYTDSMVTILPTTMFAYNKTNNSCSPITNAKFQTLNGMTKTQAATELNANTYLRQPFHLTVNTSNTYPQAKTYDLTNPGVDAISLVGENTDSTAVMSITQAVVIHQGNGTGGFVLRLGVKRSASLQQTDYSLFKVLATFSLRSSTYLYAEAEYYGTAGDLDLWDIIIPTSYHISIDNYIEAFLANNNGDTASGEIPLISSVDVKLMIPQTEVPGVDNEAALVTGLPGTGYSSYLVMARQTLTMRLGTDISTYMNNIVTATWSTATYKTYPEAVYYTYAADLYQRQANGLINTRTVTDAMTGETSLESVTLASIGDTILSTQRLTATTQTVTPVNTNEITVDNASYFRVGMIPSGMGLTESNFIKSIAGNVITMNAAVTTEIPAGTTISIQNPNATLAVVSDQTAVGATLSINGSGNIGVGDSVFGFDIPAGATVASVDPIGGTVTLSAAPTVIIKAGTLITFINKAGPGSVKNPAGSNVLDDSGSPIIVSNGAVQYLVKAIMFDARLYLSDTAEDQAYVQSLPTEVTNYLNAIKDFSSRLWEVSNIYFDPMRTFGYGDFNTGGGSTQQMSLALSLALTLYVTKAVYNDDKMKSVIESAAVTLATAGIRSATINVSDICTTIKNAFPGYVSSVSSTGLNGDSALQVVSISDPGAAPSINQYLDVKSDGSLELKPDISIAIVLQPEEKS